MPVAATLLRNLPVELSERVRVVRAGELSPGSTFVLYWMRVAVRGHENPALDVALQLAGQLGLGVLVYHALSERYPYASDRHHTFILEGARDVQAELAARGIPYVFHLERPGHRGAHLKALAQQAALVVTEEMPVPPLHTWTERLASHLSIPLWSVDSACVVPMTLVGRPFDRAFAYRDATAKLRAERLQRPYQEQPVPAHPPTFSLPFEPVDLQTASVPELVASCEIDHSVGPVPHTVGGSKAGYARWTQFRDQRLRHYARDRNDALRDGVSRMSPYFHMGHVSPFRVVREAAALRHEGAEKYLDELLIWRELAYAWCFQHPNLEGLEALPGWARATLQAHATDERPRLLSWERLARAQSGDPLWDAAQTSLRVQGELHNNVRMTWGKALPFWTRGPQEALQMLLDLNHRYALDGRDPASYGGLLWCLGLFDRPFEPEGAILGTVRPRPTAQHAERLDPKRYLERVRRPARGQTLRIAMIGAGVSGLMAARTLADHGHELLVLDKARGPGGRVSTRRADAFQFDHGAQYFTVKDRRFGRYVRAWLAEGLVAEWQGRLVSLEAGEITPKETKPRRFVAVPGMNGLTRHLAEGLEVRFNSRVLRIERGVLSRGQALVLESGERLEGFDVVLVSTPAPQALPLVERSSWLNERVSRVRMTGCWAVMCAFATPLPLAWDGAFVQGSPLSWVARNASKPGRGPQETWVLHASPSWSEEHMEDSPEQVLSVLLGVFERETGLSLPPPLYASAHRWRYDQSPVPLGDECLYDPEARLGVCGDWCVGGRVEGAFLSGAALAGRVLGVERG